MSKYKITRGATVFPDKWNYFPKDTSKKNQQNFFKEGALAGDMAICFPTLQEAVDFLAERIAEDETALRMREPSLEYDELGNLLPTIKGEE